MKEITSEKYRLSKAQERILHTLYHSPFSLKIINVYHILGEETPYCYFVIWRALKTLRQNLLVERIGMKYTITPEGFKQFENRRLGIKSL